MHGGWSCERSDFTRFCIIMHELVWLWDGHATFQTQNFSKHNIILQEMCFHQWFWHCVWKVNTTKLVKILHVLQRCCLFPRIVIFLFSILRITCPYAIYNDLDACNEFCIILLYRLPYIHIYIYYLTNLLDLFTLVYVSRKICIWYWANMSMFFLTFLLSKRVFLPQNKLLVASFLANMSSISSCKFCIFWRVFCMLSCCSWVLFKKEHVQIKYALLQTIV